MEGFMPPYGAPMQGYASSNAMMGYGFGPFDMPFAGGLPQDPFGMQGYMMPVAPPPHRYDFNLSSAIISPSPCSLSLSLSLSDTHTHNIWGIMPC
jgi:E3 ubiquitin-protein ligase RBBP6